MGFALALLFSQAQTTGPRLVCNPGELCDPMRVMGPWPDTFDLDAFIEKELRTRHRYWQIGLDNSRLYWPMVMQRVEQAGLPPELTWLPLVESAFESDALSRKGAMGIWQFIPGTARAQGLRVDTWVDERLDPVKSTDAALAHLRDLYAIFGDWNLALAAYNAGSGRVWWALYQASVGKKKRRRISYAKLRKWCVEKGDVWDYWDAQRYFPRETRRYVPLFYAGLAAVQRAGEFGVNLADTLSLPDNSDTLLIDFPTDLYLVADILGVDPDSILLRNPELVVGMTPPDTTWLLRVPPGTTDSVACALEAVKPETVTVWLSYRAKKGDNLWKLAKKYGTTPEKLASINGLNLKKKLKLRQHLRIPQKIVARAKRKDLYPGRAK